MLDSLTLLPKSTELPRFVLLPERASLYFCGFYATYFLEYFLSILHSSEDCMGPCSKHSFSAPVVFFLERLNFCLASSSTDLLGVGIRGGFYSLSFHDMTVMVAICPSIVLEGVCPLYTRSAISIFSKIMQV